MKALIGTAFNAPKVTAVRYDGGQTAEELEKALVSRRSSRRPGDAARGEKATSHWRRRKTTLG